MESKMLPTLEGIYLWYQGRNWFLSPAQNVQHMIEHVKFDNLKLKTFVWSRHYREQRKRSHGLEEVYDTHTSIRDPCSE